MKNLWIVKTLRGSEYRIVINSDVLNANTLEKLEQVVMSFDSTERDKIVSADYSGWCLCGWEDDKNVAD